MTVDQGAPAQTDSTALTPRAVSADEHLDLLTGVEAQGLLEAAVATAGGQVLSWRARQVDHRPGSATTVSYSTTVRWPEGERQETLGATTAPIQPGDAADRPGSLTLSDGSATVRVWRFPLDPALPALAKAVDPGALAALMTSLGVTAAGESVSTQVRAYRPGRRAVIEVTAPEGRLFLKVVRPGRVAQIHERHAALHSAGLPVPKSLGWSDDGIVALQALNGTPMRPQLLGTGPLPSGAALLSLVQDFPAVVLHFPRRRSWTDAASHYANVIGSALPEVAEEASDLSQAILAGAASATTAAGGGDEACHGDLYEAQILLDRGRISGLLDIDSFGPGRRADDLACMVAHASVLALMHPHRAQRLETVALDWATTAERHLSAAELRYRTAGVLLSLATGPHRVQERNWQANTKARLAQVAHWVRRARDAEGGS